LKESGKKPLTDMPSNVIEELTIESLAYGGHGLGHHAGKVVFVPFTAPGDQVRCRVQREKKRYAEAVVDEILSPAPDRRTPPCPVFGECGGCQWQHLPYAVQLIWKSRIFRSILERQAGIDPSLVRPVAGAPEEWGYRSRAQIKIRRTDRGLAMGFFRRGSHYVVDAASCPILQPRLNETWALFRQWLERAPDSERLPQLDLETGDDGRIRAVLHYIGSRPGEIADYLRPRVVEADVSLLLQSGRKDSIVQVAGTQDLSIRVGDPFLNLRYGPGGFAQINLDQNRAMVGESLALFPERGQQRILDLFCGMGNFSLPLSRRIGHVVGVENYEPAIAKARQNASANGIDNAEFHALPAAGATSRFSREGLFDLILLDPPRSGAYDVSKELVDSGAGQILYISCDPPTLARDLLPLIHGGYRVAWSRPFDLFPQTHHTESMTLLTREQGGRG
jgi:23S rRNA (uracil1939-C5)-methyltransferase